MASLLVLSSAGAAARRRAVRAGRRDRRPPRRRGRRQRHRPRAVRRRARRATSKGPRLSDLDVMASTEGAPIPRVYGRARLAGQVIWATKLEEVVTTRTETERRQGRRRRSDDDHDDLHLFRQFRGRPVRRADRRMSRASGPTASCSTSPASTIASTPAARRRTPDPLIVAKEGDAPAYRGLAYVVFERLPLGEFRQPHSATLVRDRAPGRAARTDDARGDADPRHHRVRLRAGRPWCRSLGPGQSRAGEPPRRARRRPTSIASLDDLQAVCPEPRTRRDRGGLVRHRPARRPLRGEARRRGLEQEHASARPGRSPGCRARPRIWFRRSTAGPAFGGTPSDASVDASDRRAEGARAQGHALSVRDDGYSGRQRAARSADRRGAAAGLSLARPHHLRSGARPARLARRHARRRRRRSTRSSASARRPAGTTAAWCCTTPTLAASAGGVDAFLIGSELRGLTRVRSASGVYPAVTRLAELAADVKAIVGAGTIVTYGADWTEYGAHVVDGAAQRGALSARSAVGVVRRSTRSASTITRRSPTGATTPAHLDRALHRLDLRSRLSRRQSARRRGLRLVLRRRRRARARRRARRSPTGSASRGCSAPRICGTGGRTRITSASAAPSLPRRPPGCRRASRSGSPRSAAPPSTRARTSRARFPIRNRPTAACRISPTAGATT